MNVRDISKDYLVSALQNVKKSLGEIDSEVYKHRIAAYSHLQGANKKLKMIADARGENSIRDLLREVDIALIFIGLGHDVEIEPDSGAAVGKNIDMKLSRGGKGCYLEATRFVQMFDGPKELGEVDDGLLHEYGDITRDVEKACQKIILKFKQLGSGPAIIAIWNDDQDMEEIEVGMAIRKAIACGEHVPTNLLFILYISDWLGKQQMYCYPPRNDIESYAQDWMRELENSYVRPLIDNTCKILMGD